MHLADTFIQSDLHFLSVSDDLSQFINIVWSEKMPVWNYQTHH